MKFHTLAGIACALPLLATAAPAKPAASQAAAAAPPTAFSQERYASCGTYVTIALLAAAEMQTNGVSAKNALVASGNPISPGLVALTDFAASTLQSRKSGGKDSAANLGAFLTGVCYQRGDLPTIATK